MTFFRCDSQIDFLAGVAVKGNVLREAALCADDRAAPSIKGTDRDT